MVLCSAPVVEVVSSPITVNGTLRRWFGKEQTHISPSTHLKKRQLFLVSNEKSPPTNYIIANKVTNAPDNGPLTHTLTHKHNITNLVHALHMASLFINYHLTSHVTDRHEILKYPIPLNSSEFFVITCCFFYFFQKKMLSVIKFKHCVYVCCTSGRVIIRLVSGA